MMSLFAAFFCESELWRWAQTINSNVGPFLPSFCSCLFVDKNLRELVFRLESKLKDGGGEEIPQALPSGQNEIPVKDWNHLRTVMLWFFRIIFLFRGLLLPLVFLEGSSELFSVPRWCCVQTVTVVHQHLWTKNTSVSTHLLYLGNLRQPKTLC